MENLIIKDINGKSYTFDEMIDEINSIVFSKSYTQRNNEIDIYDTTNEKHINIFVNSIMVILKLYTIDDEYLKQKGHFSDKEYIKFLHYLLGWNYC